MKASAMSQVTKYLMAGAMALSTLLSITVLWLVLPALFNGGGWVGFFVVPVIGFAMASLLAVAWAGFIKKFFNKEEAQ